MGVEGVGGGGYRTRCMEECMYHVRKMSYVTYLLIMTSGSCKRRINVGRGVQSMFKLT